jgi:hypothetical protein
VSAPPRAQVEPDYSVEAYHQKLRETKRQMLFDAVFG